MAEENYQKIKLLKIMEILRQETDEDHPMTKVEPPSHPPKRGRPPTSAAASCLALLTPTALPYWAT